MTTVCGAIEMILERTGYLAELEAEGGVEADPPRLAVEGEPTIVRVAGDLPLKIAPKDDAPTIGTIDAGK